MATLARYQSFALDALGNVLASPTVEVRDESSGSLAPIFSDRTGASGMSNPFTGGSDGLIAFHVAGGAYKITVTSGATVRTFRYVAIGTGGEHDYVAPAAAPLQRTVLTSDITYFVRTDGSDGNTGLANTSGAAFLTIQKAINVLKFTIDFAGFKATIQCADGTYTGAMAVHGPWVGAVGDTTSAAVIINGNSGAPGNVIFSTVGTCIQATHGGYVQIQNCKLQSSAGSLLYALEGGSILFNNIVFGAAGAGNTHIGCQEGSFVKCLGNYSITGGGASHMFCVDSSYISVAGFTITLTGTPAFTTAFAWSHGDGAVIHAPGNTYSGSATGKRYQAELIALIDAAGGANYFPGNVAGTADAATFSIYN